MCRAGQRAGPGGLRRAAGAALRDARVAAQHPHPLPRSQPLCLGRRAAATRVCSGTAGAAGGLHGRVRGRHLPRLRGGCGRHGLWQQLGITARWGMGRSGEGCVASVICFASFQLAGCGGAELLQRQLLLPPPGKCSRLCGVPLERCHPPSMPSPLQVSASCPPPPARARRARAAQRASASSRCGPCYLVLLLVGCLAGCPCCVQHLHTACQRPAASMAGTAFLERTSGPAHSPCDALIQVNPLIGPWHRA